jgi:RNA polymerase sigma-70 factor (ECF subfamily)
VVDAFLAASRDGDFARLVTLLAPDVVLRADAGDGPAGPSQTVSGIQDVLAQARRFAGMAPHAHRVLVNGSPGFVVAPGGQPFAVIGVSVRSDRIVEIDILADPARLQNLDWQP